MSRRFTTMEQEERPLILLIDDDPDMINLMSKLLQMAGYRTVYADSGSTGLAIAQKYKPDAILMNLQMPGIDGYTTCRELRSCYCTAEIPIVFVTAVELTDEVITKGLAAGANDFLRKTFTRQDLLTRVRVVLREHNRRDAYRKLATLDPTTGLANRRQSLSHIAEGIASAQRHQSESILLLGDIDKLAAVEEQWGEELGNELIVTFSRLLNRFASSECLVGRIGGDEFIAVLLNSTKERGLTLADRLRRTFAAIAFDAERQPKHFSLSLGLASCDGRFEGPDPDAFMRQADVALFAAKQRGRGRHVAYWDLDPQNLPVIPPNKRHSRCQLRAGRRRADEAAPSRTAALPNPAFQQS